MMDIKEVLLLWFINIFDKKIAVSGVAIIQNEQFENKLHKPIIRKFIERRIYSSFKDNISGADLADM